METIAEDAESENELGNCVVQIGVNVWAMSRYGVVHCRRQIAIRFCVVCWFCGLPPHALCRRHLTIRLSARCGRRVTTRLGALYGPQVAHYNRTPCD
jgi:hypothetical protein